MTANIRFASLGILALFVVARVEAAGPPLLKSPFDAKAAKSKQQAWAKFLKREVVETNSIGMKLALVAPGEFVMGVPPTIPSNDWRRIVDISKPLYMGIYTVTQTEYEKVTGKNPSSFSKTSSNQYTRDDVKGLDTSRFPVESMSRDDALRFCRKLSDLPAEKAAGRNYRLPTSAEWEWACRAGTVTLYYTGDKITAKQANVERAIKHPTTVGSYPANAFGLYDMHGNVAQLCSDLGPPRQLEPPTDAERRQVLVDPQGLPIGPSVCARGGDYRTTSADTDSGPSGVVQWIDPKGGSDVGFRVVCVAQKPAAK